MAKRPSLISILPPHVMPEYTLADVVALKAMFDGAADADQQKRFLNWILNDVCPVGSLSYHPKDADATAFKEGRRSVGVIINTFLRTPLDKLKRTANATSESASLPGRAGGRTDAESEPAG